MRTWMIVLALIFLRWPGAAQEPARSGNPDRGMFIYSTYCASCHGEEGYGDGPVAPRLIRDFGVGPANLVSEDFQNKRTDATLAKAIREGGVAVHRTMYMPAWGLTLSDQQVTDLVAFLRELREPVKSHDPPGSMLPIQTRLELGRTLYGLYCSACHGGSGTGNGPLLDGLRARGEKVKAVPNLTRRDYYWTVTDRRLADFIRTGFAHSGMFVRSSRNSWWHRTLQPHEYDALILYLRSLPLR